MNPKKQLTASIILIIAIALFSQLAFAEEDLGIDQNAIDIQSAQNNVYANIIEGNNDITGLPKNANDVYIKMIAADKAAGREVEGVGTDTEIKIQQIMNDAYLIAQTQGSTSTQVQTKLDEAYAYLGLGAGGSKITRETGLWIFVVITALILCYFIFFRKGKKALKQKKTADESLFGKLRKKVKSLGLRLIDLFRGKHLKNQQNAIQKIIDSCKELHTAAAKEDIYFILEDVMQKYKARTGKEMINDLEDSVRLLIHEDENVIGLISTLEKLNKSQEDVFMKEQFSAILKPSLKSDMYMVFEQIKSVLNEMKILITTRLYGRERKAEEGLHRLLHDLDDVKKIVGHPESDKNAHKINELQQSMVNETKKMEDALNTTKGYISQFESLFMQEESLNDMTNKEIRNRKELAVDLVKSFDRLVPILKKTGDRVSQMNELRSNSDTVYKFVETFNEIIKEHPEKNRKTAIKLYVSYYKEISESLIPDEDVDGIIMAYESLKGINLGGTKILNIKT